MPKSRKYNKVKPSGIVAKQVPFTDEHQVEYHEKFDTLWEQFGWQTPYVRNFIDGNKTIRIAVTALMTEEELEDPTIDKAWEVEYKDGTHARLYTKSNDAHEDHYVRRADPIDYFVEYINRAAQFGIWHDVEGHFCLMAGDTLDNGTYASYQLDSDMAALYNIDTGNVDIYVVSIPDDLKADYLEDLEIDTTDPSYDFALYKEDCINRGYATYAHVTSFDSDQQKLYNLGMGVWLCKKAEIGDTLTDGTRCLDRQWTDCYIVKYNTIIYALAGFKYNELISDLPFLGQHSLKKTMTVDEFNGHMFAKWGLEDADGDSQTFGGRKIRQLGDEYELNFVKYTFKRHAYSGDVFYVLADEDPTKGHPNEVYKITCEMDPQYHTWSFIKEMIEYSDAFMQWCGEGANETFDEDGKIYAEGLLHSDCDGTTYNKKPGPSVIYMVRKPMDPILYPDAEIITAPVIQKVEFSWDGIGSNAEVNEIIDVINFIDLDNKDKALAAGHAFWEYCNYERMYVPYTDNYIWYEENLTNSDDYLFRFNDEWFSIKNYEDDLYNESEYPLGSKTSVHYDLTYNQVLDHVYAEWALGIRSKEDLETRFDYDLEHYEFEKTFELDGKTYGKIVKDDGSVYIIETKREESQIYSYTKYTENEFVEYWLNHNCNYADMKVLVSEITELLEDILEERIVEISEEDVYTSEQIGWTTTAATPYNLQGRIIAHLKYTPGGYKWVVENRIPTDAYRLAIKFRDAEEGALIDDIYKIDNAEPGVTLGIREDTNTYFKIQYELDYDFLDADIDEKIATEAYIIAKWLSENEVGETNDRFQRLLYRESTYFTTDDNVGGFYCFEWDDEAGILSHGYLYVVDSIDEVNLDAVVTCVDCSSDLKNDRVAQEMRKAIEEAVLNEEFRINNKKNAITKTLAATEDMPERVILISEDNLLTYAYVMDNINYPDLLAYDRSLVGVGIADYTDHMYSVWAEKYANKSTHHVYDGTDMYYVSTTDGDRIIAVYDETVPGDHLTNFINIQISTDSTTGVKTYSPISVTRAQWQKHELATLLKNAQVHDDLGDGYAVDGIMVATDDSDFIWTLATKYEGGVLTDIVAYDNVYEDTTTLLNVTDQELHLDSEDYYRHKFGIWLDTLSQSLKPDGTAAAIGSVCLLEEHEGITAIAIDTTTAKEHIVYDPSDEKYYRCTIKRPTTEYPLYDVEREDVTELFLDHAFVSWLRSADAFVGGPGYDTLGGYYGLEVVAKNMVTPYTINSDPDYEGEKCAYVSDGVHVFQIIYDDELESETDTYKVLAKKDVTSGLWQQYLQYLEMNEFATTADSGSLAVYPRNGAGEITTFTDSAAVWDPAYVLTGGNDVLLNKCASTTAGEFWYLVYNTVSDSFTVYTNIDNTVDGLYTVAPETSSHPEYDEHIRTYVLEQMFREKGGVLSPAQETAIMQYLSATYGPLDGCSHVGVVIPTEDFTTDKLTFYTVPSDWSATSNRGHKWVIEQAADWRNANFTDKDKSGPSIIDDNFLTATSGQMRFLKNGNPEQNAPYVPPPSGPDDSTPRKNYNFDTTWTLGTATIVLPSSLFSGARYITIDLNSSTMTAIYKKYNNVVTQANMSLSKNAVDVYYNNYPDWTIDVLRYSNVTIEAPVAGIDADGCPIYDVSDGLSVTATIKLREKLYGSSINFNLQNLNQYPTGADAKFTIKYKRCSE